MMKKFFSLILVLVIAAVSFTPAFANTAIPGGPFSSAIQIQNLGNEKATIVIQYIDKAGVVAHTGEHEIAIADVLSVYVPSESGLASGEYSVVISSDQPVAAISNFSDADSGASYSSESEGALSWGLPGLYNDYWGYYSEIYAQNVSDSPQAITMDVYAPNNPVAVYTDTKTNVPSKASVNWSFKEISQLSKNVSYSAVVRADGNIVAMGSTYGSGGTAAQLYSYNGFSSGAKVFYVPGLYNNYYGWNAAISIQNMGDVATNVSVKFSGGEQKSYSIQPKSAESIYVPTAGVALGEMSAVIESTEDVAVSVNISNSANRAATYNGASKATTKVYVPNVMKRYYKYSSAVTCQNIGTAATTMTIKYAATPSATKTSELIQPGSSWLIYMPSETAIPDGYNAGATVEADQPIVCIVNSNMDEAPESTMSMDQLFSYNGVNQ